MDPALLYQNAPLVLGQLSKLTLEVVETIRGNKPSENLRRELGNAVALVNRLIKDSQGG